MRKYILLTILLLAAGCNADGPPNDAGYTESPERIAVVEQVSAAAQKIWPLQNASGRITKKMFGTYVVPSKSRLKPERFRGYHTGVDFETTVEEKGVEVPVYAICEGKVLTSQLVGGYGGSVTQGCKLNDEDVTVVYGHLALASLPKIGAKLAAGDRLGILGEVGKDTAEERKHLHLGIHKGTTIDFRAYVQKKADLEKWIDFTKTSIFQN